MIKKWPYLLAVIIVLLGHIIDWKITSGILIIIICLTLLVLIFWGFYGRRN